MKHTKKLAKSIMRKFEEIGIRTKLIGSLEHKNVSENDIDLVLLDHSVIDDALMMKIEMLFTMFRYTITDWGGVFIETLNYNVDLFPNSFMKKCYHCKKKCCLTR